MIRLYDMDADEASIVKKIYATALRLHGIKKRDISVEVSIVSAEEIHTMNMSTRGVDKPTDVLSFPALDGIIFPFKKANYIDELSPEDGKLYIGEIVICREIMQQQAQEYGHSERRELAFLTTHGMLHLLGYDHIEPDLEKVMRAKEDEILSAAKFFRE